MVYQKQIFREIQAEVHALGRDVAKTRITEYMQRLYALDLDGRVYFYEQDQDGLPIGRILTSIAGERPFYSTLLVRNILDVSAWRTIDKPKNFEGGIWQPWTRADLLGCKTLNEACAECDPNSSYNDSTRDDDYFTWVEQKFQLWHEHIDIRHAEYTGYGLYARKAIPSGCYIGEYTGIIAPYNEELTNDQTVYQFEMSIGKLQQDPKALETQPSCWIDATKKGSVFRFLAHSCDPNAAVTQARCGTHNRILAVYTLRTILPDEPITIDYGADWFTTRDQPCHCGTQNCKNPPRRDDADSDDSYGNHEE